MNKVFNKKVYTVVCRFSNKGSHTRKFLLKNYNKLFKEISYTDVKTVFQNKKFSLNMI